MTTSKNITYPSTVSKKLAQIVLKLKIKKSKNISQEDLINKYIVEGLARDEKKLKQIIIK